MAAPPWEPFIEYNAQGVGSPAPSLAPPTFVERGRGSPKPRPQGADPRACR